MTLTEVLMAAMVSAAAAVGYQSAAFAHRGLVAHAAGLVIGAAIGVAGAKALWRPFAFSTAPTVVSSVSGSIVGGSIPRLYWR